jgi:hypothetical protein
VKKSENLSAEQSKSAKSHALAFVKKHQPKSLKLVKTKKKTKSRKQIKVATAC